MPATFKILHFDYKRANLLTNPEFFEWKGGAKNE